MEKEKFNAKRFFITLGIVLVAVGATAGPTWYFMNEANKINEDTISFLQEQLEKSSENEETSDETADWERYTDDSLGVSFKYPSDWFVKKDTQTERTYIANVQGDYNKGNAPENFQQVWISDWESDSSVERENNTKAGNPDCCEISGTVKASTMNSDNILINTYEYTTTGGSSLEAYWQNTLGERFSGHCSTENGGANQDNEVIILKKILSTLEFTS